jgi:large subunit ribosomal protein L10
MPNPEKVKEVADLAALFKEADSVAVTDYAGLSVEKMTLLRRQLREAEVKYLIAKNTLLRLAAQDSGRAELNEYLAGPTAVAFGSDAGRIAKILYDFGKDNEKPEVRALYMDGVVYGTEQVERIAKLPSREQLLSQLVGTVMAPLQNLVGTLQGVLREFMLTIEAIKDKVEK